MLLIGAAGAAVGLAIGIVRPAGAHVCSTPVATEVGAPVTVNVGVAVETLDPVTGVDVGIPDGVRGDEAPTDPPWEARVEPTVVRYRGGSGAPGSCLFFSLRGEATERAALELPVTLLLDDGSTRGGTQGGDGHEVLPTIIYAGVDPPGSSDGLSTAEMAVVGVVVAGAAGATGAAGWWAWRRAKVGSEE